MLSLTQIIFNTNYYSEKLVSENENLDAKKELAETLVNFDIKIPTIAEHMISMDVPKYVRLSSDKDEAEKTIERWLSE